VSTEELRTWVTVFNHKYWRSTQKMC